MYYAGRTGRIASRGQLVGSLPAPTPCAAMNIANTSRIQAVFCLFTKSLFFWGEKSLSSCGTFSKRKKSKGSAKKNKGVFLPKWNWSQDVDNGPTETGLTGQDTHQNLTRNWCLWSFVSLQKLLHLDQCIFPLSPDFPCVELNPFPLPVLCYVLDGLGTDCRNDTNPSSGTNKICQVAMRVRSYFSALFSSTTRNLVEMSRLACTPAPCVCTCPVRTTCRHSVSLQ